MSNATVVKSNFNVAMEAMLAHHLSRRGGDFFVAQPHFRSLAATATKARAANDAQTTQAMPEILRSVNEDLASRQQVVADAATTGTNEAANGLKTSKSVSDFQAKMEAQKQKAIDDSKANITAAFDKATQLGVDHPETQSAVLAGMNVVQNIIGTFTGLLEDMVSKVVSLVTDILKDLMKNFEGVLSGFAGEAGEVLGGLLAF